MPEGHTLHHLARRLDRALAGQVVASSSPQGRFGDARRLDGRRCERASAKGKHLYVAFEGDRYVHVHLGLFGRTRLHKGAVPTPRGAVRWRLVGEEHTFDLVGPTACEVLGRKALRASLARLGPDPLRPEARLGAFRERVQKTRRPIGAVLLDQRVIAGIGNVYRAELLFVSNLDPHTPARDLEPETVQELWRNARTLLRVGAQRNSIRVVGEAVVRPPRGGERVDPRDFERRGRYGPVPDRLWVYNRRQCKICGGEVRTEELAQRRLHWCPTCQTRRS